MAVKDKVLNVLLPLPDDVYSYFYPVVKQIQNVTINGNSDHVKITYLGPTFDPIHYPAKSYSFERDLLDGFDIQKNYAMQ